MEKNIVAIASDHAGFKLKTHLLYLLQQDGYNTLDLGTNSDESVDYPIYASKLTAKIENGQVERGVLICGSGIGISIAANRSPSVRAALCRDADDAEMSRRHNDANVIALSGSKISVEEAWHLVKLFLITKFDGGRHARRVNQIS